MKNHNIHYLLAFTAGFSTMAVEMAGARALAPFFGTSAFVWAALIAVVMVYIFLGNINGGRALRNGWTLAGLCRVHIIAAVTIAIVPQAVQLGLYTVFPLLPHVAPVLGGALLLSVAAISTPVFLLSYTSPWLIGLLSADSEDAARTSGHIYAVSTAGGLLGTVIPVMFSIPLIGVRLTFVLTATVVALCALCSLPAARKARGQPVLAGVFIATYSLLLIPTPMPAGVIHHEESMLNSIWVADTPDSVQLMVNERQTLQSRSLKDPSALPFDVWGLYATAPFMAGSGSPKSVLFLGLGAGSAARYYRRYFPEYALTGVEIDDRIIAAGKKYFDLDSIGMTVINSDARAFLSGSRDSFDIIVADAFTFPYLPDHLSTVEFMREVNARLRPGGVALFNVGRYGDLDATVNMMAQTGLEVFGHAYAFRLPNRANTLLYFMNHPLESAAREMNDRDLKLRMMAATVRAGMTPVNRAGSPISTDDRPLSELLTNRIILQAFGVIR